MTNFTKIIIILSFVLSTDIVYGAGSSSTVTSHPTIKGCIVNVALVGDDANGDMPDTTLRYPITSGLRCNLIGMNFVRAIIIGNHGGTEPTDSTDVFIYIAGGGVVKAIDMLSGGGANLLDDDTNATITPIVNSNANKFPISDTITMSIAAEQAVNNATGTVVLYFEY